MRDAPQDGPQTNRLRVALKSTLTRAEIFARRHKYAFDFPDTAAISLSSEVEEVEAVEQERAEDAASDIEPTEEVESDELEEETEEESEDHESEEIEEREDEKISEKKGSAQKKATTGKMMPKKKLKGAKR